MRATLPSNRAELRVARLQDPLPDGPFDVIVSVLTIHHLDAVAQAELFDRIAKRLVPGGRFVLGDVVVPENPSDVVTPLDRDYDTPSSLAEQLSWLTGRAASTACVGMSRPRGRSRRTAGRLTLGTRLTVRRSR